MPFAYLACPFHPPHFSVAFGESELLSRPVKSFIAPFPFLSFSPLVVKGIEAAGEATAQLLGSLFSDHLVRQIVNFISANLYSLLLEL